MNLEFDNKTNESYVFLTEGEKQIIFHARLLREQIRAGTKDYADLIIEDAEAGRWREVEVQIPGHAEPPTQETP